VTERKAPWRPSPRTLRRAGIVAWAALGVASVYVDKWAQARWGTARTYTTYGVVIAVNGVILLLLWWRDR
jgi:hypothetical protein